MFLEHERPAARAQILYYTEAERRAEWLSGMPGFNFMAFGAMIMHNGTDPCLPGISTFLHPLKGCPSLQ